MITIIGQTLGKTLRELRKDAGRTIPEVAADIRISVGFISLAETGKRIPSGGVLRRWLRAVSADPAITKDCIRLWAAHRARKASGEMANEAQKAVADYVRRRITEQTSPAPRFFHEWVDSTLTGTEEREAIMLAHRDARVRELLRALAKMPAADRDRHVGAFLLILSPGAAGAAEIRQTWEEA